MDNRRGPSQATYTLYNNTHHSRLRLRKSRTAPHLFHNYIHHTRARASPVARGNHKSRTCRRLSEKRASFSQSIRTRASARAHVHFSHKRPIAMPGIFLHMIKSGWCFACSSSSSEKEEESMSVAILQKNTLARARHSSSVDSDGGDASAHARVRSAPSRAMLAPWRGCVPWCSRAYE